MLTNSVLCAVLVLAGDPVAVERTVPEKLMQVICDDSRPAEVKIGALLKVYQDYDRVELEDLRKLEQLFLNDGADSYLKSFVVQVLGSFGDRQTLITLLKCQKQVIGKHKKLGVAFAAALFELAERHEMDIRPVLLPPFKGILLTWHWGAAESYKEWLKTQEGEPVAAPDAAFCQ